MKRLLVTLVVMVALAIAAVQPGQSAGPPHPTVAYAGRIGMDLSHVLVTTGTSENRIAAELRTLKAGGVDWVREDLPWAVTEPQQGLFDWRPLDRLMDAAATVRMHVLGILDYSAPWASSDPSGAGNKFYPPAHDRDFALYAAAVASRYGSTGTFWRTHPRRHPTPLAAVEIWNEPYGSWFWKPSPDPIAYDHLVGLTAPAVHAADPDLKVLMSGDLQSWSQGSFPHIGPWLTRVLTADRQVAKLVDGLAVHPYPQPRQLGPYAGARLDQSFARVALIRRTELALGIHLPIWITEVGWSTVTRNNRIGVSDHQQATYIAGAVRRAIGDWGAYVPKIFIYGWFTPSSSAAGDKPAFGLLNPDGSPKPAWQAIVRLLHK
jgi:hypothetical protein